MELLQAGNMGLSGGAIMQMIGLVRVLEWKAKSQCCPCSVVLISCLRDMSLAFVIMIWLSGL